MCGLEVQTDLAADQLHGTPMVTVADLDEQRLVPGPHKLWSVTTIVHTAPYPFEIPAGIKTVTLPPLTVN
jgi:hypothetical protein